MLTLMLLRHAKSSWDGPALDDFERPLAKRGIKAAPQIGCWIATHGLAPDLVLCSGAIRTRATLALLLPELAAQPAKIAYDDALYLAAPADLMDTVRRIRPPARTALVVGHNPGLHALALSLTRGGAKPELAALAQGFPTAALAVLRFHTKHWQDVGHGSAELAHFVSPKQL